ncbi:MAG: putative ATP-grasp-modified RiPP [Streptomycetales bacterium]
MTIGENCTSSGIPFGLSFMSPPPEYHTGLLAGARLDPVTQLGYLGGELLHEAVSTVALATGTGPDGRDAIAVDTDQPND